MTTNQLAYLNLQEQQRSNLAREAETHLYNTNMFSEQRRHNLASEQLEGGKLSETVRHNLVSDLVARQSIIEQERANRAREEENERHNRQTENIENRTLIESARHNEEMEQLTSLRDTRNYQLGRKELKQQGERITLDRDKLEAEVALQSAAQGETMRHNVVSEVTKGLEIISGTLTKILPFM